MSILTIRRILERRLNTIPTPLQTAYENTKTSQSPPYQRVFLFPSATNNAGISSHAHSREIGFMQVSLFYPAGGGTRDASLQAERIRDQFPAGHTEIEDGLQLVITKKPHISSAATVDGLLMLPVSIYYEATEL